MFGPYTGLVAVEPPDPHESADTRLGLWVLGQTLRWPRWAQVTFVLTVAGLAGAGTGLFMLAIGR